MGLKTIVTDVGAFLHANYAEYAGTVVDYGRKKLTYQTNQGTGRANRVIFCPSKSPGNYADVGARTPGQPYNGVDPLGAGKGRALATLSMPYEVHCWAFDASKPGDEQLQDDAALLLANAVIVALRSGEVGGVGSFKLTTGAFTTLPVEVKFGSEFTFLYVAQIRVVDLTNPAAIVASDNTAELGDESEEFPVPPAP